MNSLDLEWPRKEQSLSDGIVRATYLSELVWIARAIFPERRMATITQETQRSLFPRTRLRASSNSIGFTMSKR
jgi:hypothetical protein